MDNDAQHDINIKLSYAYANACYRNAGPLENLHSAGGHLDMDVYKKMLAACKR